MEDLNLKCSHLKVKLLTQLNLQDNLTKFGIGTDIENIERFRKKKVIENQYLLSRIFTKEELRYCFSKNDPATHLAARFAAKEAIFKAINSIRQISINFKKIEIVNNDLGIPKVNLIDNHLRIWKILISLSHCKDKAIAFAIAINNQ